MIYGNEVTLGYSGEETTFDVVATTGEYDYSWSETAVLKRRPDGALFLAETGGCSCNSFEDNMSLADLVPVQSFDEALRKVDADERAGLIRSKAANGEAVDLYNLAREKGEA